MSLIPNSQLIRQVIVGVIAFVILATAFISKSFATECRVLRLQKTHHEDVNVFNNACHDPTSLSLQSVIEIQGGTRLWLEKISLVDETDHFQIICQNQSQTPLKIKLSSPFLPWITPLNFPNCQNWEGSRLTCQKNGQDGTALLCVIAKKQPSRASAETQLKTSLVMRETKTPLTANTSADQKLEDLVKPGIDLCRKLVNTQRAITISWRLGANGLIVAKSLTKPFTLPEDQIFTDCALEVFETTNFPPVSKEMTLTSTF